MNNLIKHYFPSLVFLGLFFMISCTDDPEMIRVSDSIWFTSDIQNTWLPVGTRGTTEDTYPSTSLLNADGMKPLYLHTLYTDSIEPLSANNTTPSTRSTPVNVDNMYETFGVSAYHIRVTGTTRKLPITCMTFLSAKPETRGCHHPVITGPAVPIR